MQLLTVAVCSSLLFPAASASLYGESTNNHTCQLGMLIANLTREIELTITVIVTPYLSCSANAQPNITDPCCVETYGGLVLSTQYWDTYTGLESQGQLMPRNTWTLHGQWPDFCNGSFTQYCDLK
jgi:ribonuclease T2